MNTRPDLYVNPSVSRYLYYPSHSRLDLMQVARFWATLSALHCSTPTTRAETTTTPTAARTTGMNCIKIGLPGKLILSKRKGLLEVIFLMPILSENRFSGKTYFYTIASRAGNENESNANSSAYGSNNRASTLPISNWFVIEINLQCVEKITGWSM